MYLHKKIILLLIIAIVGTFSCLYGYQSIPRFIRMQISNQLLDQSEFDKFLADYNQYQMGSISFCSDRYCIHHRFIFNSYFIDESDMIQLLLNEPRVRNPRIDNYSKARIVSLELHDDVDECELIESYSQYRFRGSIIFGTESDFSFDTSLIYPINMYDMIKSDQRVLSVRFPFGWAGGVIMISANRDFNHHEFLKSYAHFGDISWGIICNLLDFYGELLFDYLEYNEFYFLEVLRNDERIDTAEFDFIFSIFCEPNIFVSQDDETVVPITRVSVFPNPVMNNEVNIQVITNDIQKVECRINAEMSIYNIRGQRVFVSNDFQLKDGELFFIWNNRDNNNQPVASGVYFYRINVNNEIHAGRLLVIK